MWRWEFVFLIVLSAAIDFFAARRVHGAPSRAVAKRWLAMSLVANLGLLAFFKYTYFVYDNIHIIASSIGVDAVPADLGLRIILPLGISFYTFQSISYTIDVYRGVIVPTNSFGLFFTYVTFWPQLIAGPILRAAEVIPLLQARRTWNRSFLSAGVALIVAGLFKKVVLADNIAPVVDYAFRLEPALMNAFEVWTASILFGFQIYFDFSGYSDIAIGSALLCGIPFPKNFDWPYLSTSPRDFWKRWHISLSSWIRDYLYLPLTRQQFQTRSTGGMSVATETSGRTRALFFTWAIMGLWHGAAWTFVLWGVYHAFAVYSFRALKPLRVLDRLPFVSWGLTLAVCMAGWIPFRAPSLDHALAMFATILDPRRYYLWPRHMETDFFLVALLLILSMPLARAVGQRALAWNPSRPAGAMAYGLGLAVLSAVVLVYLKSIDQFIYFQF